MPRAANQLPDNLPIALTHLLYNSQRADLVTISESGALVYRVVDATGDVRYLKIAEHGAGLELAAEAERTAWLAGKLPVPRVLFADDDGTRSYLLTTGLPGIDTATLADQPSADVNHMARLLAQGLRRVHAVPVADCPFDHTLTQEVERARQRVVNGLVDEDNFDAQWQGWRAADLFQELLRRRPATEDLVFTHGDYCLPNILITGDAVSGFIDLGRAGIGDRYRDLALCQRSLIRNCGPASVPIFWAAYGLPELDDSKYLFYRMMDEFF